MLLLLAFARRVPAAEPTPPPGRDYNFEGDEEGRALTVQRSFQEAGTALAETHAEALRRDKLQRPLEELRGAMEQAMIRIEPEKKGEILRRYEIHRQMKKLEKIEKPSALDKEQYQALLLDFTNLSESLGDLPERAAKEPDVLKEREKFHTKLLQVMTEINPRVPELMKQQKTSIAQYNELEKDLLKKHVGPKPPAAAPAQSRAAPKPSQTP
ncbi:MAG: hypothetical protein QOD06_1630 [Candidatus Binatota bacterium]|nr:hypothetical protein [Candidatus Binatota bacterium]